MIISIEALSSIDDRPRVSISLQIERTLRAPPINKRYESKTIVRLAGITGRHHPDDYRHDFREPQCNGENHTVAFRI